MYCHRCGNKVPPDSEFCNSCGSKIRTENSTNRTRPIPTPIVRPARRRVVVEDQISEEPFVEEDDEDNYDNDEIADYEDISEEAHKEGRYEEGVIFTIYPAFHEVGTRYVAAILFSVAVTALIAYFNLPFWIAIVFAAACFVKPIYHHIQNNHTVYKLTTTKIEIKSGLLSVTSRNIPLRHIQDVSVSETFKERLIGIGDVVIDSAAIEGKISMRNIKNPRKYVDMILNQL
ncbi:MAG: PH domain-containing protein [Acidobacteriota bacterium]|nr:PH domain-containing protein [Acidobacteriota bacterium]